MHHSHLLTEIPELAIEVVVLWGDRSVLHIDHLHPVRDYIVGEPNAECGVDFVIGAQALRRAQLPLCERRAAKTVAVIPCSSSGNVVIDGRSVSLEFAERVGLISRSAIHDQAWELELELGRGVQFTVGDFSFVVRGVHAEKIVAGRRPVDRKPFAYVGASAALVFLCLLILFLSPPRPRGLASSDDEGGFHAVSFATQPLSEVALERDRGGAIRSVSIKPAALFQDPGKAGLSSARLNQGRIAISGKPENQTVKLAKHSAAGASNNALFLALGTLRALVDAPTSPYGGAQALGVDPESAAAALKGINFLSTKGTNGFDIKGTGTHNRANADDSVASGPWTIPGLPNGVGNGLDPTTLPHPRFAPRNAGQIVVRMTETEVYGGLSKEVIQRVVRQHHNEIRFCYEQELNSRPDLGGRVSVRFVIGANGSVQSADIVQSTVQHSNVEQCIANAARRWIFPEPQKGGTVSVMYPFILVHAGEDAEE